MALIECDGGDEADECGSTTFRLNFKPPLRAEAICTECGNTTEIGGDAQARATTAEVDDADE